MSLESLNSYYQFFPGKSHVFILHWCMRVRGEPYSCSLVFAVYSSKVKKVCLAVQQCSKAFLQIHILGSKRSQITTLVTVSLLHIFFFFLLAFCTSISSLLLLQYHGQFHIFLEALLCMAPVFVPVEVPVRARDRGTEVKARFISVYTLNHQGGQLSFRVISTKKLVRSNCPFLESLDTCFLMSSFFS